MMRKSILYIISLIASVTVMIIGAFFKIEHWAGAQLLLSLGTILAIPFVFLGIIDALTDKKNESMVKLMWGVGFIFLSWIAGFAYLGIFRRRNTA